ncbi:2-oxoacid:acceptor oxidoreductase subunit alpha [archaeon CG07_land_8_20_14_0_80_38_8]|nr:MAG: 2-oxoacid:acceptor oxidoreductase subunit alpha [archaeon CG07_land_8_20_14_0_80_38_8]PIU89208.1 MAG: 2-oxoacid:acceptor oxidoreductase subunit alpha [archaeon CG06_land_8_20_14_3_00_37_11]
MSNEIIWRIGGEAGYGTLSAGMLLSNVLKDYGYYVFSTDEYPSLIRGGHNNLTVRASKDKITSHTSHINILVALDELTIKKHKDKVAKNGCIIHEESIKVRERKGVFLFPVPFRDLSKKYGALQKVMQSTIGIGATAKILGLDLNIIKKFLKKSFGKKGEKVVNTNFEALKEGYDSIKNYRKLLFKFKKSKKKDLILIDGNNAISIGAIRAGCRFLSSYPMTPSTGIMQFLASMQKEHNILVHQTEDEIAALNFALGASYAGVRSMAATSGGGFALMNETLSLAGCAEIPVVIILGQRPGPATGLPTRTEQGDLRYAFHAGHGEFPRVIFAPGDAADCFNMTLDAFNLADEFQIPAIILTDKYLSVSLSTVPPFKSNGYNINRGEFATNVKNELKPLEKFKRYAFTKSGVSPRTIPGVRNGIQLSIGDEHDEEGNIVEGSSERKMMMDKRLRKINGLAKALKNRGVSVFGDKNSENAIVAWGSTKGIILEALKELKIKFVQVKVMKPFPADELIRKIGKHKMLILAENNPSGQLGSLISEFTDLKISHKLLKYDGRQFTPDEIINFMKKVIK